METDEKETVESCYAQGLAHGREDLARWDTWNNCPYYSIARAEAANYGSPLELAYCAGYRAASEGK